MEGKGLGCMEWKRWQGEGEDHLGVLAMGATRIGGAAQEPEQQLPALDRGQAEKLSSA